MPAPATIDEFLDLVAQSELVDAKSIIGLLLTTQLLADRAAGCA